MTLDKRFTIKITDYGAELCDTGECIMESYECKPLIPICELLNKQDELITKLYTRISYLTQDES